MAMYQIKGNNSAYSQLTIWMASKIKGKWLITNAIRTPRGSARTESAKAKAILGQIITLENTYFNTNGSYVNFALGANCPRIGFVQPRNARFNYCFQDSVAIALERVDTNGDGAADDSLVLSVTQNKTAGFGTAGKPLSW